MKIVALSLLNLVPQIPDSGKPYQDKTEGCAHINNNTDSAPETSLYAGEIVCLFIITIMVQLLEW